MSPVWAIAILVGFFVAFGILNRGARKPNCHGCEHSDSPSACGACEVDAPRR